jgi:hypothetical protein
MKGLVFDHTEAFTPGAAIVHFEATVNILKVERVIISDIIHMIKLPEIAFNEPAELITHVNDIVLSHGCNTSHGLVTDFKEI